LHDIQQDIWRKLHSRGEQACFYRQFQQFYTRRLLDYDDFFDSFEKKTSIFGINVV